VVVGAVAAAVNDEVPEVPADDVAALDDVVLLVAVEPPVTELPVAELSVAELADDATVSVVAA
jgi:hypothetical protein